MPSPIKNPRDITKQLLDGDFEIGEFQAFEPHEWFASGMSCAALIDGNIATSETRGGVNCFNQNSPAITSDTVFNIASITKTFTAATILRMQESEKFMNYFPQGIETRIADFLNLLKERYPYSNYIQHGLEQENNFYEITLVHLLNHTSGIGDFDGADFNQKLRFASTESLAQEPDGKFFTLARREPKPEFGKYSYSNLGYELLGMIISAIASNQAQEKVLCGQLMREMVIGKLGLEHTFTPDLMYFDDASGMIKVLERPDQLVAQGFDCEESGCLHTSQVFRRVIGTSGIYSTSQDLLRFYAAFFDGSLFEQPQTFALLDDPHFKTRINGNEGDYYGIGHEAYRNQNGIITKFHGGRTAGYFNWIGFREDEKGRENGRKVACCLTACQNLTQFFARAIFESKNPNPQEIAAPEKNRQLHALNSQLLADYSLAELTGAMAQANLPNLTQEQRSPALLRGIENLRKEQEQEEKKIGLSPVKAETLIGQQQNTLVKT